jgi:hypothetical protein
MSDFESDTDDGTGHGEDLASVRRQTASVNRYVTFVGYPRSGHSLVGSLLDAHPNIIISHEADALAFVDQRWDRLSIWATILRNSQEYAKNGRVWEQFAYGVPCQWNGRFRRLQVIGDKKGGRSTMRLAEKPELLLTLRGIMKVKCQFIHVIRNPYDNISTIARRNGMALTEAVEDYFMRCDVVRKIRVDLPGGDWFDLRQEALIQNPADRLRELCGFLQQPCEHDYLRDCSSIVYKSPHQSRHEAPWTPTLIGDVLDRLKGYPLLDGYTFEN